MPGLGDTRFVMKTVVYLLLSTCSKFCPGFHLILRRRDRELYFIAPCLLISLLQRHLSSNYKDNATSPTSYKSFIFLFYSVCNASYYIQPPLIRFTEVLHCKLIDGNYCQIHSWPRDISGGLSINSLFCLFEFLWLTKPGRFCLNKSELY